MDRDKRWDRNRKAFDLYTQRKGEKFDNFIAALRARHAKGEQDEFMEPIIIENGSLSRSAAIEDGDVLMFYNFRADRMRQIVSVFLGEALDSPEFKGVKLPKDLVIGTLTEYEEGLPVEVLFRPITVKNHFGEVISNSGLKQLRIAETEKYAHVTYFFNGGVEDSWEGEERILIPSPRDVPTYDHKPQMSAFEVTDKYIERLKQGDLDVIVCNFANCDMVGHTGSIEAAVKAVETVDTCVGRIVDEYLQTRGTLLITADHGNADQMIDYNTKEPHTFHTMHPVPLILVGQGCKNMSLRDGGALCDIAPTALDLIGLEQPEEMTGSSLISR
jgi:2,3-bisphosphoglycerate-independent phosphoglycerate mutase